MTDLPTSDTSLIEAPYEFQKLLGFQITHWSEGRAVLEQPLRSEIGNRYGIPHGGVHATLLDTVMGFAGCWTGDKNRPQLAMTLNLNVSYLGRPQTDKMIATGWKTGGGQSTFFCQGEIRDDLGTLIATGSGAFRYRKQR